MNVRIRIGLILAFLLLAAGCETPPEEIRITNHVADWRDEIIYQVLIDRFENGDPNNDINVIPDSEAAYHGGDYQGLIDRLGYLQELGVTALWISPVVRNVEEDAGVSGYHGYWTQDFTKVNPHFGDLAKLRELVEKCHARGIKVILDIVTNHIGQLFYYDINRNGIPNELVIGSGDQSPITRTSEWDPDFDERGIQSQTSLGESGTAPITWVWSPEINRVPPWPPEFANEEWYNRKGRVTVWGREKDACYSAGRITAEQRDDAAVSWRAIPECFEYVRFQEVEGDFPGGLKDVKTTLPEVRQAMIRVYADWIRLANFDAFRIDTLKHVEHGFWRTFCPGVRTEAQSMGKRNFYMFGEAFDDSDSLLGEFTRDQELDGVFYFSQKFTAFDGVVKSQNPTRTIEDLWSYRLPNLGRDSSELHYETAAHTGGPADENGQPIEPYRMLVNFLDNHDLPRFLYQQKDTTALHTALKLLMLIDGIPCVYYGTEQNFNGGNDPANREDLWKSGFDTTNETFRLIQRLASLRRQSPALRRGDLKVVWSSAARSDSEQEDAGILAFERVYGSARALVVLNLSATRTSRTGLDASRMQTGFPSGSSLRDLFGGAPDSKVESDGTLSVELGPGEARVYVAE